MKTISAVAAVLALTGQAHADPAACSNHHIDWIQKHDAALFEQCKDARAREFDRLAKKSEAEYQKFLKNDVPIIARKATDCMAKWTRIYALASIENAQTVVDAAVGKCGESVHRYANVFESLTKGERSHDSLVADLKTRFIQVVIDTRLAAKNTEPPDTPNPATAF